MTEPRTRGKSGAADPVAAPLAASLAFKGTDALIALSRQASVTAILFDGNPLPPDRWRDTGSGNLRIACPPFAFDSQAHSLRLEFAGGDAPLDLAVQSDYRRGLDGVGDRKISGWIYDVLRPDSSLTLEVAGQFWPPFSLLNTIDHPALNGCADTPLGGGFEIVLPPRPANAQPEMVRITVRGTAFEPFGPVLRGTTLPAAITAAAGAARALGRNAQGLLAGALLPAVVRSFDALATQFDGAHLLTGTLGLARAAAPSVDVVVPAYRGVAESLACLHSVLASGDRIAHRVVVIDDCSPEPALTAALQNLAADGRVVYLRNETNLGFVGTANRGLALPGGGDVLLLNSDTVVPPGFLDRLYRAAYSDPAIATVTPLSNNATICSLPAPPGTDDAPYGLDAIAIDEICRTANASLVRDLPTAHGFCMFIKRAAIDDVGLFDADTFGAGYGEENDFSLRAFERGWRNVCAGDVYVRHLGAVSFAETREVQIAANLHKVEALYPYYHHFVADFLRTDPLHELRNRVQKAVWRRIGRIVLFVTLALEGGAVRHVNDMMQRLTDEGCLTLALCMGRDTDNRPMPVVRRWDSGEALRYPQPARVTEALADILDLAPQFIHVQHLIDLPDGVGAFIHDCGIPYAVTLHDFFYGCPRVTLLDEGGAYCGMPPVDKCTDCIRHAGAHASLHPSLDDVAQSGPRWRRHWDRLLRDAMQVIAPSQDTADRYAALFAGLQCDVRPHFGTLTQAEPLAPSEGGVRVAVPGAIGPQKGARQLVELVRHCGRWDSDIGFAVIGHTDRDKELERYENLSLSGRFKSGEAVAALRASGCTVALFLSIFPETYSYTLSESLAAGLVPVAYDFGAIGERLRALGVGVLVPLHAPPEQLAAAIRQAAAMRLTVPFQAIDGQYARLLADYYAPALVDLAESIPPPDLPRLLAWPDGVDDDRWCHATATLQIWSPTPIQRLMLSFWVPDGVAFQAVEITCAGHVLARVFLDEAQVKRVVCQFPASEMRFADLTCRFDFVVPLQAPDLRARAAMFSGLEIGEGNLWRAVELPELPV